MSKIDSTPNTTNPSISNNYFNIAGVKKADDGDFQGALESFSKAIEQDPKNYVSYFNRASIKMQLGDIEGAMVDFKLSGNLEINRTS